MQTSLADDDFVATEPTTSNGPTAASQLVRLDDAALPIPSTDMTPDGSWSFHRSHGSALDFHARDLPALAASAGEVWAHHCDRPALVLGSAQPETLIDVAAAQHAGFDVGRRRSGGGVVVITPGTHLWIDLFIGPLHPLWDDDVHRAFDWAGAAWARTIRECTGVLPHRHDGPPLDRVAGRLLCFAGLGAGELSVDGAKLVGLSQRRTRAGARFQTMLELADHSEQLRPFARGPLADLLALRAEAKPPLRIGLPPTHPELAALNDLEQTLAVLVEQLPRRPVSRT